MTNHKPFAELTKDFTPERREQINKLKEESLRIQIAYNLAELRKQRHLTQVQLAELTGRTQASISAMETAPDNLLSTIQTAIQAMGGTLHLTAIFDDQTITLTP